MRIACLSVPLFPLAARLRAEPGLTGEAVAICTGSGPGARVLAATRAARRAGIRVGQTLAHARTLLAALVARPSDPLCERAAQEALLELAERFSPRVEDAAPGVVFLDLTGLGRIYRTARIDLRQAKAGEPPTSGLDPEGAQALGRELLAAASRIGLPIGAGIATSKLAAEVAAGLAGSPRVVAEGEETAFLAPLPLARLAPELDLAATLTSWGLRSIGDFAQLSAAEVHARLGAAGTALHAVARGVDPRPLAPRAPREGISEGLSLEWPLATLEPLLFVGRAALERLLSRLESRGLGCQRLDLELRLEPDGHDLRTLALPSPTREVKTLLTLIRLELEARAPGAPVIGFVLTAYPGAPTSSQLALFGPAALSPDRLATTLARLFALLGPGRVGAAAAADSHRPEAFQVVPFLPPPPPLARPEPAPGRGLLAVRTLRPPLPLEVHLETQPGDGSSAADTRTTGRTNPADNASDAGCRQRSLRPHRVRPLVRDDTVKRLRLDGEVRVAAGPWRLEEGWWSTTPVAREYWDLELLDGALVRVFREPATDSWYADGVYD